MERTVVKVHTNPEIKMRRLQRTYAKITGYFWIPCPLCGREFGGHEWHDIGDLSSTIYIHLDNPMMGSAICPVCTAQGRGENAFLLPEDGIMKCRFCDKNAVAVLQALDGSLNRGCDEHAAMMREAGARDVEKKS